MASRWTSDGLNGFSVARIGRGRLVAVAVGGEIDQGVAYVAERTEAGIEIVTQLIAADGRAGDRFGHSVAVDGDTAVVGAYGDDTAAGVDAGSVTVFTRVAGEWIETATLTAGDGVGADRFGASVDVDGDTVAIHAPGLDTAAGVDAGATYVFVGHGDSWTQQAKVTVATGPAVQKLLPRIVALQGDTLVIGSDGDDSERGVAAGAVYVLGRTGTTWTQRARLTASDSTRDDNFGETVSIDGHVLVVGMPHDDFRVNGEDNVDAGSAYVFQGSGPNWTQQAKLAPAGRNSFDVFGLSVAVSGDRVVVGAAYDDRRAKDDGSASLYQRLNGTWIRLEENASGDGDRFYGRAVAVDGDLALVGAPFDGLETVESEAVYSYAP